MSIKVNKLYKQYNAIEAIKGISFNVPSDQIVGFLGPNGAGKSTLMKILTTFLAPTRGEAYINGFDILKEAKQVQQSVGYLPEHNPLYLDQYAKEYLWFNAQIYNIGKKRINEVIELTGLQNELKKKIGALSKGYRQRVGLACALLHDPKVLLLDEPTTGLDPNQLEEIRSLIKNLGKNKTVLLSTHVMQEVEAMCDRVLVINQGKLVADKLIEISFEIQLLVSFTTPVEKELLKRILGISEIHLISDKQFVLSFIRKEGAAEQVFDFAVANQLKITQLEEQQLNIEDLFKSVTQ